MQIKHYQLYNDVNYLHGKMLLKWMTLKKQLGTMICEYWDVRQYCFW